MQGDSEKYLYLKETAGKVFRNVRKTHTTLTCNKAEEEYDISRGNLNRFENGKTDPSLTSLWKMAEASGQKLSYIIGLIEDEVGNNFSLTD